ncbi:MAG: acyloxyacyl hydrolase [Lentisphaerae bacterium]|nr:acyloxyacyl hydrolase [Lentisphaerota bacterium]
MEKLLVAIFFISLMAGSAAVADPAAGDADRRALVGVMAAVETTRAEEEVDRYEVFVVWPTGWRRAWDSGWALEADWMVAAGILSDGEHDPVMAAAGPRLSGVHRCGLVAGIGWKPTLISEHYLGNRSLGGALQFGSEARLGWRFGDCLEAGLAFEHVSNGGLYTPNPGLNQFLLDIGVRF